MRFLIPPAPASNDRFIRYTIFAKIQVMIETQILPLSFSYQGRPQTINPVILREGVTQLLIDCGYGGFLPLIEEAARGLGIDLSALHAILITHHDIDHMGALYELKAAYPHLKVYASEADAPYVSGEKKSLRLQQAEALFPTLPEEQRTAAREFQQRLSAMQHVPVDYLIADNSILPGLPGARAIRTPGHMPGHVSVFLEEEGILVAGDALVFDNGRLNLANPQFTLDWTEAMNSVRRIRELAPRRIICFHGGEASGDLMQQLDQLLANDNRG